MPNTTYGLPYPLGTDKVRNGAANIQALAQAIDPRLGGGYRSQTDSSTATIGSGVWVRVGVTVAEWSSGTDVTANGGGMTCAVAGWYRVDAFVAWAGGLGTGSPILGFGQLADSAAAVNYRTQAPPVGAGALTQAGSWVKRMSAGETVALWVLQSSGSNATITTRRLAVHRVAGN
jgi:hypothetical protein